MEPYTIKVVLEWLPNYDPRDKRFRELDEPLDNSTIFDTPYLHTSIKDLPSVSAQLGKPVPANSGRVQATYGSAAPRVAVFQLDEAVKRECITFIFDYRPEGKRLLRVAHLYISALNRLSLAEVPKVRILELLHSWFTEALFI